MGNLTSGLNTSLSRGAQIRPQSGRQTKIKFLNLGFIFYRRSFPTQLPPLVMSKRPKRSTATASRLNGDLGNFEEEPSSSSDDSDAPLSSLQRRNAAANKPQAKTAKKRKVQTTASARVHNTRAHTHTHTRAHARTHTHTHTHAHTHAHTHTHTHTLGHREQRTNLASLPNQTKLCCQYQTSPSRSKIRRRGADCHPGLYQRDHLLQEALRRSPETPQQCALALRVRAVHAGWVRLPLSATLYA